MQTRPSHCNGDATATLTMIWERLFGDVADVPVVSPTSQSRWKKLRSVELLRMSPMHRRHVPVDAGTSPSLKTIWKRDLIEQVCTCRNKQETCPRGTHTVSDIF